MATPINNTVVIDHPTINAVASMIRQDPVIIDEWSSLGRALGIVEWQIVKFRKDLLVDKLTYSDVITEILELWVGSARWNISFLILILEEEVKAYDAGASLRQHFGLSGSSYHAITWRQLSPALQGNAEKRLHKYFPHLRIEDIEPILKGPLLAPLIKGISQTIPASLSYYVPRKLLTRNVISSKIFEKCPSHIFLISGMKRPELSYFAGKSPTDKSSSQINQGSLTVTYIVLERPSHFQKICSLAHQPVHWLHFENKNWKWIKSRGGLETVQAHIDKPQDSFHEAEFLNNLGLRADPSQPICICDSPGMGKSVLLAQIGRQLTRLYLERTVVHLELREVVKYFKEIDVKKILQSIKSSDDEKVTIELLLDGFDEIDSADWPIAHEILGGIRNSCKSIRLWVTSRPHWMNELERTLDTLGFTIEPFSEADQVSFLTLYWDHSVSADGNSDKERFSELAKHCLKHVKSKIDSKDNDISGIPLQCLLIAEVYKEEATDYASNTEEGTLPNIIINSVADLYGLMIKKKFGKPGVSSSPTVLMDMHVTLSLELIFSNHFERLRGAVNFNIDMNEILKDGVLEGGGPHGRAQFIHRTFAEYFAAWYVVRELGKDTPEGRVDFNEFFIGHVLHNKRYYGFTHPTLCYFINFHIGHVQASTSTHHHGLRVYISELPDSGVKMQDLAHACATDDYFQIFNFFVDFIQAHENHQIFDEQLLLLVIRQSNMMFVKLVITQFLAEREKLNLELQQWVLDKAVKRGDYSTLEFLIKGGHLTQGAIFQQQVLLQAIQSGQAELVWLVLTEIEKNRPFDLNMKTEAIREAVRKGEKYIVEFLLEKRGLKDTLKTSNVLNNLLHDCVEGSAHNSGHQIDNKLEVIRILVGIKPDLLEIQDGNGKTPLLSIYIHQRLLAELIRLGANVLHRDKGNLTILHLDEYVSVRAKIVMNGADYHSIVMSISDEHLKRLIGVKRKSGHKSTPLIDLVRCFDPELATLEAFKKAGADFNCKDGSRYPVLAVAVRSGRNGKTIRRLMHFGANVYWKNWAGKTLLHYAAGKQNPDAVAILPEWLNLNEVNWSWDSKEKCVLRKTPLDYAMERDKLADFEMGLAGWRATIGAEPEDRLAWRAGGMTKIRLYHLVAVLVLTIAVGINLIVSFVNFFKNN